jgi:electron transfer flavoprotein beta subunit
MEIVVLVKQVPDTESLIEISADGVSIKKQDIKWVMNPYDEIAVEEALQIREAQGGSVTVVSMGGVKAVETIRTALAMGADKGVHINDPAAEGSDALATAKILAAALKEISLDLIIAGHRAVDEDNYQVAAGVAEFLGIPQVSMVIKAELLDGKIKCQRTIEGGTVFIEAPLPALFTTQRGLNEPRYASLPGIMKAKKKPVDVKTIADLGLDAASVGAANRKVKIKALNLPPERQAVRMIEGDSPQDKAAELVRVLHEEAKLI